MVPCLLSMDVLMTLVTYSSMVSVECFSSVLQLKAFNCLLIRTNNRKFTINYSGPVFWNTLPQHIRKLRTVKQFKGKLKELLLMGYVS